MVRYYCDCCEKEIQEEELIKITQKDRDTIEVCEECFSKIFAGALPQWMKEE